MEKESSVGSDMKQQENEPTSEQEEEAASGGANRLASQKTTMYKCPNCNREIPLWLAIRGGTCYCGHKF